MNLASLIVLVFLFNLSTSKNAPPILMTAIEEELQQMSSNDDDLVLAHVIFRHGERNIAKVFPNDPYKDEVHWPGGFGQLTNEGKMHLFKLGRYFRRRYHKILGNKYSPNKVYVQSTDTDRTLMSSLAVCSGLFPPSGNEIWNPLLSEWQPIPVHTTAHEQDHILSGGKKCPKYDETLKNYMNSSKEVQRIYKEYADLFAHWSKMCGKNITTIAHVQNLYDVLWIEKHQNKKLQDWAEKSIEPNGVMEYITKYSYAMYTNTKQLARLKGGYLLKDILERFSQKIKLTLKPLERKLWLYAAHDYTIANILNGLGVFELHIPNYASSIHFELYKTDKNKYYLQVFYRNEGEEHPTPIHVPGCGGKCPFSRFYELYQDIIPGDFNAECMI